MARMAAIATPRVPRRWLAAVVLALLVLSGCSGKDTPAVCSDAASLKKSVSAMTDVKLEQGALSELQTKFAAVKQDFAQVKSSAKSQFSAQLDAVNTTSTAFKTKLDAAVADPTAATVSAVVPTLQSLRTALSDLGSAIDKTC